MSNNVPSKYKSDTGKTIEDYRNIIKQLKVKVKKLQTPSSLCPSWKPKKLFAFQKHLMQKKVKEPYFIISIIVSNKKTQYFPITTTILSGGRRFFLQNPPSLP